MQSRPSELGLGQSQDPRPWVFYLPIFGIGKPENDGYNPQIQKLCSHMTLARWVNLLCQADRRQETRDDSPNFPENWNCNQNCGLLDPTNKISLPKQACLPGTGLDGQVLHPRFRRCHSLISQQLSDKEVYCHHQSKAKQSKPILRTPCSSQS